MMRESILISFIALIGLSGLLTIHQEVRYSQNEELFIAGPIQPSTPQILSTSAELPPAMIIVPHANANGLCISIPIFNTEDRFMLDFGNGKKRPLRESEQYIDDLEPGTYLIKLFRNHQLLEASKIRVP